MSAVHRYSQNQAETASRERLMVLLFEAALKHIRAGAGAIDDGRHGEANADLGRATDIVAELLATLDVRRSPALCEQLGEIYSFVAARLIQGNASRSAGLVREAERVLAPVAEAFAAAVRTGADPDPTSGTGFTSGTASGAAGAVP